MTMSSWNNQTIVDMYSDSADDSSKSWYEDAVNVPAIIGMISKGATRILDFGCGPGNLTARLANDFEVFGADASELMIQKAQQKYPNLTFFQWDGLSAVPAQFGQFDTMVTKLTLEFVENLPELVSQLSTALVPNGEVIISVQHPLLAVIMHPEDDIAYWSKPAFNVQIGTTGATVTKIHRNLHDYIAPFLEAGFELKAIDEPNISVDIAQQYNASAADLKFPKRLNIKFQKK